MQKHKHADLAAVTEDILLKQSREDLATLGVQTLRNILDSLSSFVCVIGKHSRRVLYFNAHVQEKFPHAAQGMTCHALFKKCKGPCENCPGVRFADEDSFASLLYDSPFGAVARLSVSSIFWENSELAYVVLASEYEATQEEKEQEKRKEAYVKVLENNFSEIYEVDVDANTIVSVFDKQHVMGCPEAGQTFTDFVPHAAFHWVHPEDRERFLIHYGVENLLSSKEKQRFSEHFRILNAKNAYLWISSLILPIAGVDSHKLLILCQDITHTRQMEDANRRLERRYKTLFRQSCDMVMEVNLRTGECQRTIFAPNYPEFPPCTTYEKSFWDFLSHLHPDDKAHVAALRSWEGLTRAYQDGITEQNCQFRFSDTKGGYRWIASRLFFMQEDGDPTFFMLGQDISAQKQLEEERLQKEQRFSLALRGIYSEIYEFDIRTDTCRLVFCNNESLIPVGVGDLRETQAIVNNVIHPDDRAHVLESLLGANLRQRFEQGCSEVVEEYRRLGANGKYYWISAMVLPQRIGNSVEDKTMLLIKDISLRKAQEQQQRIHEQYTMALRNIYDELFECNITQNTYRLVYYVKDKYVIPPENGVLSEAVLLVANTMVHPEDSQRFLEFFNLDSIRAGFAGGAEYLLGEFRKLHQAGGYRWASLALFPLRLSEVDSESDEMLIVFVMDIDQRKRSEEIAQHNIFLENQRVADERYRIIVDQTNTLVFEWARENNMRYISPELIQRFSGAYDKRDIMCIWQEDEVIHPDDREAFSGFLSDSRKLHHPEMTVRFRRRDDSYIWCKVVLACQHDETGRLSRYIGTLNDVHEATCSVLALHYRAEYDMLTGVFNMQAFYARAKKMLRENPERPYCIIRMDIDRFKVINDLYGLDEGDRLLQTIARLIGERMNTHGVCGRIGGDVFCMCVDYSDEEVSNFVHEMTEQLSVYPLTSRLVPSFGICRVDSRDTPISTLCDWAHLALKTVKGNVLVTHAFYDENLRKHILEEKKIENEMHTALEQGEFHLYLQPKVDIATGKIVGSEGLVRWLHPTEGVIEPDRFIPLFEKNGFIIRIDEYIWDKACALLRDWLDKDLPVSPLSVNVSRMHIHDTRLCEKLLGLLEKYRLPPHLLELELTESAFLHNDAAMIETMDALQRHGFHFSLDDFGAGYSSLNMLKSLPVDTIKLDRIFLSEVSVSEKGKTVVRHTIALAKAMHMKVVAEGVENAEQAKFLLDAGCTVAQGFHYSPPVPVPVFEKMLFGSFPAPQGRLKA